MVKIDEDFTPAVLKEEDKYEGKEIDANIAAGKISLLTDDKTMA
jgi:hypothetical protein